MSEQDLSLQHRYSPNGTCFGCGPANAKGLRIESFVEGDEVVCTWQGDPYHEAFEGVLNGGIVGALLDCHSNWAGIWALMQQNDLDEAPSTVTAELNVKYLKPTPSNRPIRLVAQATEVSERRVVVDAKVLYDTEVCATSTGVFIAVKPDHPAYHRWE